MNSPILPPSTNSSSALIAGLYSLQQLLERWNMLFRNIGPILIDDNSKLDTNLSKPIDINQMLPEQCEAIKQISGYIFEISKCTDYFILKQLTPLCDIYQ